MSGKNDIKLDMITNDNNGDGEHQKLYEMLKFKNRDINEITDEKTGETIFRISISEEKLDKRTTLVRESEIIRIVKTLESSNCNPRKDKNGNDSSFPFIKDIIAINVSVEGYKKNKRGRITVIFEKKFGLKSIKKREVQYKRLLASTSNIRNKKIIYIREELYEKVNEILLCGMPTDMAHRQFSKYSAYYALASTDSIPITTPEIVVIDDFKNNITGICDLVKEEIIKGSQRFHRRTGKPLKDKETGEFKYEKDVINYSVDNCIEHTVKGNKPFDGAGLVDVSLARIWAAELGLDYLPSAFQFRAIPGIKGNLYVFDFKAFADEFDNKISKDASENVIIIDAWNKEIQLLNEDGSLGINVILTKSQYKFFDYLDFDTWKSEFGKECHGYKRTFNISGRSDRFEDIKDKVLLSYQPLQSLNLNLNQIKILCEDTIDKIKKISTNVNEFMKFRGLLDCEEKPTGRKKPKMVVPEYYKAMKRCPHLFTDKYIQKKVKKDIKRFKENTYKGAIFVPGNYQTLMPDIFALAQWSFGIEPTGLLKGNQVYSRYWISRKVKEIDIIRFPHIANEHSIGEVVDINENENIKSYYKYATEGIITAIDSFIPLKANSADFDGDHVLTNSSDVLIVAYKEYPSNPIIHEPATRNEAAEKKAFKINDMAKTIDTDIKGMSNSIGRVVNKITKLWSLKPEPTTLDYIKIMSVIGSLTIDFVKTGEKAAMPKDIREFLKEIKMPDFMRAIYPETEMKEKGINRINRINKQEEIRLFGDTDCTMNRIYKYMKSELEQIKIKNNENKFDYKILMENPEPNIAGNKTYPLIVKTLSKLQTEYRQITKENSMENDSDEYNDEKSQDHEYKFKIFNSYAKKTLLSLCTDKNQMKTEKLLDYLVYAHYCDKTFVNSMDENIIWNCFGREFNKRLKQGTDVKYKEVDHAAIEKSLKNPKSTIHKIKSDNNRVNIKSLRPKEGEHPKEITVFQSEIDYLKRNFRLAEERCMAFVLISINKFCKAYGAKLEIDSRKNHICKSSLLRLSDVHSRDYETIMGSLVEQRFIQYEQQRNTTTVTCTIIPEIEEFGAEIKLTDINQCRKYLGKFK